MLKKLNQILIILIFTIPLVSSVQPTVISAETGALMPPTVTITSSDLQSKNVTISGTIQRQGIPINPDPNGVKLELLYLDESDNEIKLGDIADPVDQKWSYTFSNEFEAGMYEYIIRATDVDDELGASPSRTQFSFTVDTSRPKVSSLKLNVSENVVSADQSEVDLLTSEDMNYVNIETNITLIITDDKKLSEENIKNPIILYDSKKGENIPILPDEIVITPKSETEIEIVYNPNKLDPSTTYFILINPFLVDKSGQTSLTTDAVGNPVFPTIKKFTTVREGNLVNITNDKLPYYNLEDPHGNYTLNTNTCATCHNSHISDVPSGSEAQKIGMTPDKYCMACHDGTVAAKSLPGNMLSNDHFPTYSNDGVNKMAGECTSCHNPHLAWSMENPNLIKDHLVYKHNDSVKYPKTYDTANKEDNCNSENCHTESARELKEKYPTVSYSIMHYRKSTVTKGTSDDYDLCLSCHDGRNENVPNIKKYYLNTDSRHRISATDGNQLTSDDGIVQNGGHIPCADCHDTHGSNNIKILKGKLGHEDRKTDFIASDTDKDSFGILISTKEREFCVKCHNGSTAIYGVTGNDLIELDPEGLDGHDNESTAACSTCHGGTTGDEVEKALRSAHAPTAGVNP